jgi:hypothetical protein
MDNKDFPVPIHRDEQAEISDGKRRLLKAIGERLSRSEAIKYEQKPNYSDTSSENTFLMLDTPDRALSVWSKRRKNSEGDDDGRSISLAWMEADASKVGAVHFEDKRLDGNHHLPYEGGIIRGINLDAELERWKVSGGLNCGPWFASRFNHDHASLGGMSYDGVEEVSDDEIEKLIHLTNSGVVNPERMKSAVTHVVETAKPSGVSEASYKITFLTPTP